MKKIFVICFALLLFSCNQNNKIVETNSGSFSGSGKEKTIVVKKDNKEENKKEEKFLTKEYKDLGLKFFYEDDEKIYFSERVDGFKYILVDDGVASFNYFQNDFKIFIDFDENDNSEDLKKFTSEAKSKLKIKSGYIYEVFSDFKNNTNYKVFILASDKFYYRIKVYYKNDSYNRVFRILQNMEVEKQIILEDENIPIFVDFFAGEELKHNEKRVKFDKIANKYPHIPKDIKDMFFEGISFSEKFDENGIQKIFNYLNYSMPRIEDKNQSISTYNQYCLYNDLPGWIQEKFSMSYFDYIFQDLEDEKLRKDYNKKYFVSYSPSGEYYCDEILQKNN